MREGDALPTAASVFSLELIKVKQYSQAPTAKAISVVHARKVRTLHPHSREGLGKTIACYVLLLIQRTKVVCVLL